MDDTARKWCADLEQRLKNGSGGSIEYSLEERLIGSYFGEPLYEKTFVKNDFVYPTANIDMELFTLGNINVIDYKANLERISVDSRLYVCPRINSDSTRATTIYVNNTTNKVCFYSNDTWGLSKVLITIQYTKTN